MKKPNQLSLPRPSAVRILGRTYSISYVPPSPLQNNNLGLCDNLNQDLYAEDSQTPIEEADSILHEVLHAIRYSMKVDIDPDTEELVVSALATGLLGVLQDNPEFAQWLIADKAKDA